MKRIASIIISLSISLAAMAQEQPSKKQQADALFERYEYSKSLSLYLQLAGKNNPDVRIMERVAFCYLKMDNYEEAEQWYERIVENPKADLQSHYNYAEVLLRDEKFAEAKKQYQYYYTEAGKPQQLAAKLALCDSAALWLGHPTKYKVENVKDLNTEYADWGLNYDGKTGMVFTSDRKTETDPLYTWTGYGYLKLYTIDVKGNMGDELHVDTKSKPFVNADYHIGPMATNAAGDTAYITITTGTPKSAIPLDPKTSKQHLYTRRLQLVMATKTNGQWGNLISFPYNNVEAYSVGHAALSPDGGLIYFTSDMPGGEGKTDIWYCQKQTDGTWGKPINCGKAINTPDEEAFPEVGNDHALYYSSKGLPGMGGFDIYYAQGQKASWTEPINLKYPVNSTADDFCFVSRDGLSGYLSSNRKGGLGNDDIYHFSSSQPVFAVPPVTATVSVDTLKNELPKPPFKTGQSFVVNNIYYDLDKWNIRPDAALELDKLIVILKQYPKLKIELSSHTDSRASDDYNMKLSQRRAEAAVQYLTKMGIAADRMTAKGYSETRLVNQCANDVPCTEAEHQLNRRTEVKIVRGE